MKKEKKLADELVTKGYFRKELNRAITPLKQTDIKLREELHAVEYRLDKKIDTRYYELKDEMGKGFAAIREEMKKQTNTFQQLADKVIVAHNNFEAESVSIRQNYRQLEERVFKVEEIVFPHPENIQNP